jgi:hypothetical protein
METLRDAFKDIVTGQNADGTVDGSGDVMASMEPEVSHALRGVASSCGTPEGVGNGRQK